jgi:hypothetical protein
VGITTQDEALITRLPVEEAADRVVNFLRSMVMEIQMLARACGHGNVHALEPEDMRALDLETALISGLPLVGMDQPLTALFQASPNGHR